MYKHCLLCGSSNIGRPEEYVRVKAEGQPAKKDEKGPWNYCRECGFEWGVGKAYLKEVLQKLLEKWCELEARSKSSVQTLRSDVDFNFKALDANQIERRIDIAKILADNFEVLDLSPAEEYEIGQDVEMGQ